MYASGDYCSKDVVKKLKLSEKTPKLYLKLETKNKSRFSNYMK